MDFIFFTLLIVLTILASAFVGIAWVRQPKQNWILPGCLIVLLVTFSTLCYVFLGRGAHIIYQEDDVALRQIAELLGNTVALEPAIKTKITDELLRQRKRPGAQPTVWILEGQLALAHQDYPEAKRAYGEAYKYAPYDADIAVSYAQAWYLAEGQVNPDLDKFLQELEEKYPEQTGLQNLLAVIAYNKQDYKQAIRYWQQLLPQYAADSVEAQVLDQAIKDAVDRHAFGTPHPPRSASDATSPTRGEVKRLDGERE
jgi:cytochrome c-type biogenesis protein CcmH/NrfG